MVGERVENIVKRRDNRHKTLHKIRLFGNPDFYKMGEVYGSNKTVRM